MLPTFLQILKKKNALTCKCKFIKPVNNSNLVDGPVPKYKSRCFFLNISSTGCYIPDS